MKIVVIGNGAAAVDSDGVSYVNRHTGIFLSDVARLGNHVTFIEPQEKLRPDTDLHDFPLPKSIRSRPLDRRRISWFFRTLSLALFDYFRADFVYIFYPGTLPRLVARLCVTTSKPFGLYLRGERFSVEGANAAVFRRARFIVSVSKSLASVIAPLNSNILPIRPMLDFTAADALLRNYSLRARNSVKLLFVGRLEPAKGVPELLEAAEILRTRGFCFELTLVGGGPLYDGLSQRYGDRLGANIRMTGTISHKAQLMRAYEDADIFVLPTHHEGFPRVLYEAMIKSAVIVTTMVGGIPGLMVDGKNCVAIPVRSPHAIAAAVERVSGDLEQMQRLSENGLKTVLNVLATYPSHLEAVEGQLHG